MVSLILIFIFFSPFVINYRDRPQAAPGSSAGVLVRTDGENTFVYEIGASQIDYTANTDDLKAHLQSRIRAISGNVLLDRYQMQKDATGRVVEYRVWAHR
jgi:hypothetical protein